MSFKKTMLAVAAIGALSAATAVPAMALENEFHGLFRLRTLTGNFQSNSKLGGIIAKDAPTLTDFEQRARLMYVAKANDDLKLITHFEVDSAWGDSAYDTGRNKGGAIGADTVNFETKNIYLDFNIPSTPVNAKVGIQGWSDAYKGIFVNDDMAGAVLTGKQGPATVSVAYFRLNDAGSNDATNINYPIGKKNIDLYTLDGKFMVSKDLTVGGSYYVARNDVNYSGQDLHMVGVNAAANLGPVAVDGFAIYQGGDELYATTGKTVNAFAAQVAGKAKVGVGSLRGSFLYTSGDKNKAGDTKTSAFQSINSAVATALPTNTSSPSNNYYSADMLLMLRSKWNMNSDKAIVSTFNNADQGVLLAAVGYDANLTSKFSATGNVGFAMDAERNTTTASSSKVIGTELNVQVNYKVYDNLMASAQGAYVVLGDRYKGTGAGATNPDDPYLASFMLNYTF